MRVAHCAALVIGVAAGCSRVEPAGHGTEQDLGAADMSDLVSDLSAPVDGFVSPDGAWVVPPVITCAPAGNACTATPPVPGLFASFRKDAWLTAYAEYTEEPKHGGRVQVAAVAARAGRVTKVKIAGVDADTILNTNPATTPPMEWYHVWPRDLTVDGPVWVAFHSRLPAWDTSASAELTIETDQGVAVSGTFPVKKTPVPITYVTVSDDRKEVIVHVQNRDTVAHTVSRLLLDGRDVTALACIPHKAIGAGEAVMWTIERCMPATSGDAYTVVAEYSDAPAAVAVGRVLPPFFPIEAWNNTSECVYPGGSAKNYAAFTAAGFDTMYFHPGVCAQCGCSTYDLLDSALPAAKFRGIVTVESWQSFGGKVLTDTSGVAAFATGDESDGEIYDDTTKVPNAANKAKATRDSWARYPTIPTFNGGKTNRNIGTFAGMADVQGMDLYVAACAPHITPFGQHPPLRGAYDYIRNTRENHMPLPTWLYAQGLAPTWNKTRPIVGGKIHVQPDPQEIAVQAFSVVAAGGKGLLWFQSNQEEASHAPARWQAISEANWIIRSVRDHLRIGDVTGMARTTGDAIVELVRARDALIVPLIGLATSAAPTDPSCAAAFIDESAVPHWVLASQTLDVDVTVPADFGVADLFEVTSKAVIDLPAQPLTNGRVVRLKNLVVDNARPARLFVLARDKAVRASVAARLP